MVVRARWFGMWYMTTLSFEEESKAWTFGIGIVLIFRHHIGLT